jgi:tetratricopeptide (TPR) repeat protein
MQSLTQATTGIHATKGVPLLAQMIYELLSGHPYYRQESRGFTALSAINEKGNGLLRVVTAESENKNRFPDCQSFWGEFAAALELPPVAIAKSLPNSPALLVVTLPNETITEKTASPLTKETPKSTEQPGKSSSLQNPAVQVIQPSPESTSNINPKGSGSKLVDPPPGRWKSDEGDPLVTLGRLAPHPPRAITNEPAAKQKRNRLAVIIIALALPLILMVVVKLSNSIDNRETAVTATPEPSNAPPITEAQASTTPTATPEPTRSNDELLAQAAVNRGNSAAKTGDYEFAVADYTEAIRLKPDYSDAFSNRGTAYEGLKQYDKAIADYSEAIRLKPDYAPAFFNRGLAYCYLEQYDKAIADYSEAIRLESDDAEAFYSRGLAYYNLKQYDKAIADYSEAIRLKPDYIDAVNNRKLASGAAAQSNGTPTPTPSPSHGDPAFDFNSRGDLQSMDEHYDEAIANYSEAIRLKPDFVLAYRNRASCYDKLGRKAKANDDRRKADQIEKSKHTSGTLPKPSGN